MPQTSRRKRPLERVVEVRDARLIVIATEGEKTEPAYFGVFHNTRFKVRVIPCERGESAPAAVLARMADFRDQYQLEGDDELWLVIDRDKWTEAMLSDVAQQCLASNVNLALSNPCFEIWLALHFVSEIAEDIDSAGAENLIKSLYKNYSKAKLDAKPLMPMLKTAIDNARSLDHKPDERWPNSVGSRVYLLAEVLTKYDT